MCLHPSRDLPPPPPTPDLLQPVLCGNPHKVGSCGSVHCRPHCLMLSCPIPGDRSLIDLPVGRRQEDERCQPASGSYQG